MGHVRQLDRVSRELLARAWAAGAGPRSLNNHGSLTIDLDSTICETYGLFKEGARHHGYTGQRGYHPLLAVAAGTGDVLMAGCVRAAPTPLAAPPTRETVGRVRHAGATGPLIVRADSGFYTHAMVTVCRQMDVRFSITIRQHATLRNPSTRYPRRTGRPSPTGWMAADVAETTYIPFESAPDAAPVRLIVRRVKPTPNSQLALLADSITASSLIGTGTPWNWRPTIVATPRLRMPSETSSGLNHLPSGRFAANAAWLAVQ